MAEISLVERGTTFLKVKLINMSNYSGSERVYNVFYQQQDSGNLWQGPVNSAPIGIAANAQETDITTISSLDPDTNYTVKYEVSGVSSNTQDPWTSSFWLENCITLNTVTLEFSITPLSTTQNSLSFKLTSNITYSGNGLIAWTISSNGTTITTTNSLLNETVTINGLSSSTQYYIEAIVDNNNNYTAEIYMITAAPSISPFSWTDSNGNATAVQTQAAYTAITSTPKGPTTNFHHLVWNDLCDKINELLSKKSLSWSGTSPKMTDDSSGTNNWKKLTAVKFNNLITNLNRTGSSQYNITVSSGSPVLGEYFINIVTVLNQNINTYNS